VSRETLEEVRVDPVTIALAVAPLVAKAGEHFGEALWEKFSDGVAAKAGEAAGEAGWGLLGRMTARLRQWFHGRNDDEGASALDTVVKAPDSQRSVNRLAEVLEQRLATDPAFAQELDELVQQAKAEPGEVGQFSVQVWGNASVGKIQQFGTVTAKEFRA
jgi:hypothetical protein